MRRAVIGVALLAAVSGAGCYTTVYQFGTPPTMPSPLYWETWHHQLFFALVEISDPVNLQSACAQGGTVSEVREEVTFLNGLVTGIVRAALFGFPLWNAREVSVFCGQPAPPVPMPLGAPPAGPPPAGPMQ